MEKWQKNVCFVVTFIIHIPVTSYLRDPNHQGPAKRIHVLHYQLLTWIDIFTKSLTPLNFEHVVLSPGIQIIHDITSPERAMNDKRYPSNITRICICIFVHVGSEMHC